MKRYSISLVVLLFVSCVMAFAQAPQPTIDPSQHGALAAAQQSIVQAWQDVSQAQRNNDAHLGGHAGRAKELLEQANQELMAAAQFADNGGAPPSGPSSAISSNAPVQNLTGNWTIFAENAREPGSSLKEIQLTQNGNILSGSFHGPHQHGKLQGWVNGNSVQFSTDTHDVLTFEGQITSTGMSGFYNSNGGPRAPWNAQRSN
jgi:hypothetical protein